MQKGYSMRRKMFVFVMALVAIIFFADAIGIPLRINHLKEFENINSEVIGKVISIEIKEDHLNLKIRPKYINGMEVKGRESILLELYSKDDKLSPEEYYRETISFESEIRLPTAARNPKCFNYRKYLLSNGIRYISSCKSVEILPGNYTKIDRIDKLLFNQREAFKNSLPKDEKGIIMGILFADTSELEEETYDKFRMNGTAHVLAVSGLHIGILYDIYKKFSKKRKRKIYMILLHFSLFCYGSLSMWSVSTIRAIFMIMMILIGEKFALRYDSLTGLSFAAFFIILFNPYVVFGASFQMSFLAIMSIKFFDKLLPKSVPQFLKSSTSIFIGLSIYQIYVFNYFAPLSILVNVPVIFLAGYLVPIALFGFLVFSSIGSLWITEPIIIGLSRALTFVNDFSTLDGHASFTVPSPSGFFAMLISLLLFFLSSETFAILYKRGKHEDKRLLNYLFALILTISLFFGIFTYSPITKDEIIFIDVGQGDSMHINLGRTDILIDGGGQLNYNVGKNTLKSYLLKNGNKDVDLAIATHMHMDHYKGLTELMDCFTVKKIAKKMTVGNNFIISNNRKYKAEIRTLWPLEIGNDEQDENKNCSVFLITINGVKIITTGDLDTEGEKNMISYYKGTDEGIEILDCDILKIGHHGSKTATSEEFLNVTSPKYAVIQVGKNMYGHPHQEVLDRLENHNIKIYRTDVNGAVGVDIGKKISIDTIN